MAENETKKKYKQVVLSGKKIKDVKTYLIDVLTNNEKNIDIIISNICILLNYDPEIKDPNRARNARELRRKTKKAEAEEIAKKKHAELQARLESIKL
jgi:hypothetical protein